jgi:hypothetical protein
VRHILGALLYEQGEIEEAVYRADIKPAKTCFCAQDSVEKSCCDQFQIIANLPITIKAEHFLESSCITSLFWGVQLEKSPFHSSILMKYKFLYMRPRLQSHLYSQIQ